MTRAEGNSQQVETMAAEERDTQSETSEATTLLSSQEPDSNQEYSTDLSRKAGLGGGPGGSVHERLLSYFVHHRRRMRGVGSKGSILVLVWTFVVYGSTTSALKAFISRVIASDPEGVDSVWLYLFPQLVLYTTWMLLFPLFGWLADVYFGRYRVLNAALHLMWVGIVVLAIALILESLYSQISYFVLLPAIVLVTIGWSAFLVNSILLGSDQIIVEASAEDMSSYIIWYIFTWLSSRWAYALLTDALIIGCTGISEINGLIVQTVISALLLSLVLCSNYLLKDWLVQSMDSPSGNPWKLTWNIMKFAATHKRPAAHSALAYSEDERVRRIELGKERYGGPFTMEQVDDVRTLLRVLLIISGFCGLGVFIGGVSQVPGEVLVNHLRINLKECRLQLERTMYSYSFLIAVGVPLYEVLVYPVVKRWIPSMLKRVGIAAVLAVLLNISLLAVNVAGNLYLSGDESEICFLNTNTTLIMDISSLWAELPFNFIYAAMTMVALTAALEFIYAQTPYCMQGLAISLLFGLTGSSAVFGLVVFTIWYFPWTSQHSDPNCGVWFFLFTSTLGAIVFVFYCILAHWYKRREREDRQVPTENRYYISRNCGNISNSSTM